MMEWSDLRYVLAVEREGTLTAAARALACDQSTVTRRLVAIQAALGARIFDRRESKYVLTDEGERLKPVLLALEEQALAIERVARGLDADPSGVVRLTTIETIAARFLGPRLGSFAARYPGVELEIDVDRRALDLGRREADLALRVARPRQLQLVVRKVAALGIAIYASQGYLAARGAPKLGSRLAGHSLVADDETGSWTPEARLLARVAPGAHVAVRSNGWATKVAMAEAGVGIAALPCLLADASPELVRLGGAAHRTERDLWLIVHRDLQRVPRVRAVIDFVVTLASTHRALLGGDASTARKAPRVRRAHSSRE